MLFQTGSHGVGQAGLELMSLLLQPPECHQLQFRLGVKLETISLQGYMKALP